MPATWATILILSGLTAANDEPPVSADLAVKWAALSAESRVLAEEYRTVPHWRERSALAKQMKGRGEEAVTVWLSLLQQEPDERPQHRDAFYFLRTQFPDHPRLREYILRWGLTSANPSVLYESQFHAGTQHWTEATPMLWQQMTDRTATDWTRFVAAKSLGEFGDARSLGVLIEAVQNERYMPRHFGNLGLKALCGKNLTDFGYEYGEGAFVSGGVEARMANPDPFVEADRKAKRFTALRDFLQWLQKEKPELYDGLVTRF